MGIYYHNKLNVLFTKLLQLHRSVVQQFSLLITQPKGNKGKELKSTRPQNVITVSEIKLS